jgi:predicted small secreted protein
MRNFRAIATVSFAILLLLTACHTTAGAGKDISAAGHAITHSADEHSY